MRSFFAFFARLRALALVALLALAWSGAALGGGVALAAPADAPLPASPDALSGQADTTTVGETVRGTDDHGTDEHGGANGEAHGEDAGTHPVFEPEHGTWFNGIARAVFVPIFGDNRPAGAHHPVVKYDFLIITPLLWTLLALVMVGAARKARIRPQGKAHSMANTIEAALEAFQDYLIGVMGNDLARKYTPLIASFFFTILVSNWLGLVPGMLAPSAMPAIPIALAIVGFFAVHIIAIKEGGFKSWILHFVGEPIWLAWLNFPLHIIGELIKPLSLSLRLLCNVFGEEAVVVVLAGLAVSLLPVWLPIPFQLPMLLLGTFFGFLQALVFSTLLAIYLSIFLTHNDDHGHGQDGHAGEHTEHATELDGDKEIVGHPSALTVGA